MSGPRPILLGRRQGVAGTSRRWQLVRLGRVRTVDRAWLVRGLKAGWLTGIERVRREDGDWGPLFGRPLYREVFGGPLEPRDHACERAARRADRQATRSTRLALLATLAVALSVPLGGGAAGQLALLGAGAAGIGAGLYRLLAAMQRADLAALGEQLTPPVLPPPEPVDWALEAARDEVEAAARLTETDATTP